MTDMKPILFNTEMVRAIQNGTKTATRRVVKNTGPDWDFVKIEERPYEQRVKSDGTEYPKELDWPHAVFSAGNGYYDYPMRKAPYRPGDIMYVRETWNTLIGDFIYRADQKPEFKNPGKWRPSIFMPREAARIFLRVTSASVERLQDITPEQIDAEGCKEWAYSAKTGELLPSGPSWFRIAWDETIKPQDRALYGWKANPWVWVIEFERCEKLKEVE